MKWEFHHPQMTPDHLGLIPSFLSENDPRPAKEQIHDAYAHGGGWNSFKGFEMLADGSIKYPGDPAHRVLAQTQLRDEIIRYYDYSWLAIVQPDGSFEIARID